MGPPSQRREAVASLAPLPLRIFFHTEHGTTASPFVAPALAGTTFSVK